MLTKDKIILSADDLELESLFDLVKKIGDKIFGVKIHNLFDWHGQAVVSDLRSKGAKRIWVDFKLHDIPNTVKLRAKALADAGADIITVHASGGVDMMRAAKEGFGLGKVYAVTALTSLNDENIKNIYGCKNAEALVKNLADLALEAGVDGIVCSPKEVSIIKSDLKFSKLQLVVPGVRSENVKKDDQQRTGTPENTLKAGADLLVVGRQITQALDAVKALENLQKEIENV